MNEEIYSVAGSIPYYLEHLASYMSGENLNVVGRLLARLFGKWLSESKLEELNIIIRQLRRTANQRNPPIHKAAEAMSLRDLLNITNHPDCSKLSEGELQAVDILVVAFATLSRVAEVAALTIRDVARDGGFIAVRAKTFASTFQRHVKCVENGKGLYPARILQTRRAEAVLRGRRLLFSAASGRDELLSSSEVTQALRRVTLKLQMVCRITSHSGRKGAAVAALLSGTPLVVIQSLGLWSCVDSLQAYVGKTVRENFCALNFMEG